MILPRILAIALGGALGSASRYGICVWAMALFGRGFPYGILCVNVLGSFLIGICYLLILTYTKQYNNLLAGLVTIGFMGGFTTFSSFSLDTVYLLQNGRLVAGILNIVLNVGLCILATILGLVIAKHFIA